MTSVAKLRTYVRAIIETASSADVEVLESQAQAQARAMGLKWFIDGPTYDWAEMQIMLDTFEHGGREKQIDNAGYFILPAQGDRPAMIIDDDFREMIVYQAAEYASGESIRPSGMLYDWAKKMIKRPHPSKGNWLMWNLWNLEREKSEWYHSGEYNNGEYDPGIADIEGMTEEEFEESAKYFVDEFNKKRDDVITTIAHALAVDQSYVRHIFDDVGVGISM